MKLEPILFQLIACTFANTFYPLYRTIRDEVHITVKQQSVSFACNTATGLAHGRVIPCVP